MCNTCMTEKTVHTKAPKAEIPLKRAGELIQKDPSADHCLTGGVALQVASVHLRLHYYWKGSSALPHLQIVCLADIPDTWKVDTFAAVHAKVSLCLWWNFCQKNQDPLLLSSHFWETHQQFSVVTMNRHENPTKCNPWRKTTVQVHHKGLWNNLKSVSTHLFRPGL